MTRSWLIRILITLTCINSAGSAEPALEQTQVLTPQESSLVEFALDRFEAHGLSLPPVRFVFHDDLLPCHGHKGLYRHSTRVVEMCSMDKRTMLHELAHAWANLNLSEQDRQEFVVARSLDSWNHHTHQWERRGTEHVAETLAWALNDEPTHVKWVEIAPDGTESTTHLILSLGIDVETLTDNFRALTGQDPMFRHSGEWTQDRPTREFSPEAARLGG